LTTRKEGYLAFQLAQNWPSRWPGMCFLEGPALAGFLPKLGPSLHPVATVISFR
jgi:hypothetical protein